MSLQHSLILIILFNYILPLIILEKSIQIYQYKVELHHIMIKNNFLTSYE